MVKRFICDPVALVDGACRGQISLHPGLGLDEENRGEIAAVRSIDIAEVLTDKTVIFRTAPKNKDKVTILSGGGSGHEPAHAGYVGHGMLDAVACGAIFASPNVLQIEKGLQLVASPRGTLVIVKNYTGDKLNFGLAVEKTRVITGNNVNIVMVADDVSIRRANIKMVGRRGLAGIVLVHKIAGAAAAAGMSLQEVTEVSQYVAQNLVTIGVGLNRCDVPGQHHMDFIADEIELGMGIHNEPGSRKLTPQPPTPELIKEMLSALLNPNDKERNYLGRFHGAGSTEAVLLVNNLGGLSVLELTSLTGMVIDQLQDDYSIRPRRVYSGTFLSALNGSGFSITILDLSLGNGEDKAGANRILSFLDAPTTATGWSPSINSDAWDTTPEAKVLTAGGVEYHSKSELERIECNGALLRSILVSIQNALVMAEPKITAFDTTMGDGDCGTTLVAGALSITCELHQIDTASLTHATLSISELISKGMGGTSGAMYAIFFTSFAAAAQSLSATKMPMLQLVASMANTALATLREYTAAAIGDRTMMDALIPFISALSEGAEDGLPAVQALENALEMAKRGCDSTRNMTSVFGRSTYVGAGDNDIDPTKGIPDPGACGIVAIAEGILQGFKESVAAV